MKFLTYWETPPGGRIPPYVALAMVSMQRALADAFVLLGPRDLASTLGIDPDSRSWHFGDLEFEGAPAALSIVAKSDFIRMAWVHRHGGFWLDADTIALGDPRPALMPAVSDDRLYWHNEALFGAQAGNPLLDRAVRQSWDTQRHIWGNPGGIRDLVAASPEAVAPIDPGLLDPGWRPAYRFTSCEVMYDRDLPVEAFLSNPSVKMLKLYNTYFSRAPIGSMTVPEFLGSGTLLARIFLHIDPDPGMWIARCAALEREYLI